MGEKQFPTLYAISMDVTQSDPAQQLDVDLASAVSHSYLINVADGMFATIFSHGAQPIISTADWCAHLNTTNTFPGVRCATIPAPTKSEIGDASPFVQHPVFIASMRGTTVRCSLELVTRNNNHGLDARIRIWQPDAESGMDWAQIQERLDASETLQCLKLVTEDWNYQGEAPLCNMIAVMECAAGRLQGEIEAGLLDDVENKPPMGIM
jgi:hypothetical protein